MTPLVFIDGNDLRAAELARIVPGLAITVEALQSGFATSAPEPGHRARDKVLAHPVVAACFAEAVDLTTVDGKSLRLELDSENENRFCKWWRETPAKMQLRRRAPPRTRRRHRAVHRDVRRPDRRQARRAAHPRLGSPVRPRRRGPHARAAHRRPARSLEFRRGVYGAMARALGIAPAEA